MLVMINYTPVHVKHVHTCPLSMQNGADSKAQTDPLAYDGLNIACCDAATAYPSNSSTVIWVIWNVTLSLIIIKTIIISRWLMVLDRGRRDAVLCCR